MNKVCISGRLTSDPELAQTKSGKSYCRFTLAVDKWGKDAGASFINCVAWDKRAETISQYVKKGQMLPVVGRLDQSSYEKDGKKQSLVSVIVEEFDFPAKNGSSEAKTEDKGEMEDLDSMIPF